MLSMQRALLALLLATLCGHASAIREATPSTLAACAGLNALQVPHPEFCQQYLVCCNGQPIPYTCHIPTKNSVVLEYSPAAWQTNRQVSYVPGTGTCEMQACEDGAPMNAAALATKRAADICQAKAKYEAAQATSQATTLATDMGRRRLRQNTNTTPAPAVVGRFDIIPNPQVGRSSTGVVAIHAALVPNSDSVLLWQRPQPREAEPGMTSADGYAEDTALYHTNNGTYQRKTMREAPFCSGQGHLSDGRIVVAAGDVFDFFVPDGRTSLRTFANGEWQVEAVRLNTTHWYPTQLTLPDDRVIVMGGTYGNGYPSNPNFEVYDFKTKQPTVSTPDSFLEELEYANSYPALFMLPWSQSPNSHLMFQFACDKGFIMSIDAASQVGRYKDLPEWPTPGWCSQFASAGTGTMLMLKPENNYATEVAMFGGTTRTPDRFACECSQVANDKAYRIKLDETTVRNNAMAWAVETMPTPRNMLDSVLLPSGHVLLVNGAQKGKIGGAPYGAGMAQMPSYNAWLYKPDAPEGQRFTVMAASSIKRLYHSVALLLPDGDVLVTGSEQDECVDFCWQQAPPLAQHAAERFKMPYAFAPLSRKRPTIRSISKPKAAMGETLRVTYSGQATHAVIITPAAVTHQLNMNQRLIKLQKVSSGFGSMTLKLPPVGGRVAPPGWYMLFLMNEDVPCIKARWFQLTTPVPTPPQQSCILPRPFPCIRGPRWF